MTIFQRIAVLFGFMAFGLALAPLIALLPRQSKPETQREAVPTATSLASSSSSTQVGASSHSAIRASISGSSERRAGGRSFSLLRPEDHAAQLKNESMWAPLPPTPQDPLHAKGRGALAELLSSPRRLNQSETSRAAPLPRFRNNPNLATPVLFATENSAQNLPPAKPLANSGGSFSQSNSLGTATIRAAAHVENARAQHFDPEGDGRLDINIPNTDIREVLELLSKAGSLNILASPNVTGQVKASLTGVDVNTALAAILRSTGYVARREGEFVYVGTAEDFQAMDHSVDRIATRVYRPNYITSNELQTLLTPMLTSGIGTVSVSSAAEVGIAADGDSAGGNNFAGAEVVLVRDYEAVLAQVDQVFDEVDRRPLQVSIEAMILSVKLTDEHSLGVDWEFFRSDNNLRLIFGSPLNDLNNINVNANSGLVFGYLDSNVAFFLDALEKVGETHVISQPRLMCLNKQRAEIHIGEERGYVSTTVTETAATQSVEFLEVGTQLRLRPFISSDGLIRLEVHPELSTGTVEVSDNFTLPNKTVTQVTTNVMVRDGATLVIGGLLREDLQMDTEQIPLLGSLPVVGPLFRSKTDKTSRDEIIVLITPRIVWEPKFNCEGEYADCEFHQQHAIMADKMSHTSRVYYGRKYRRLAKAAWVAGEAKSALRYINMSIHFNRLDRESIHLRSEIIAGSPYGDRTVHSHLREGLMPWQQPLIGGKLNDWVLDELHGPHTHLNQEPAPVIDGGVGGPRTDLVMPEPVIDAPRFFEGEPIEGELIDPEAP